MAVSGILAASLISSPTQPLFTVRSISTTTTCSPGSLASSNLSASSYFAGTSLRRYLTKTGKVIKINRKVNAAAVATPAAEELKEYILPTWAEFDIGKAPVFWKTMNGLPPSSGEQLRLFYNPAANKLVPNEEFGVAFNGGFNQPIMCGGEPRSMLMKVRGKADPPMYIIRLCIPKHARSLIFSFTNGNEWDGPYKLEFQVPRAWKNKPIEFFNEGLAEELNRDGACDAAIFPDSSIVITRCDMIGNLSAEGGDRCNLDFVEGCLDPNSPMFNPLANVDDGSCPIDLDSEE